MARKEQVGHAPTRSKIKVRTNGKGVGALFMRLADYRLGGSLRPPRSLEPIVLCTLGSQSVNPRFEPE